MREVIKIKLPKKLIAYIEVGTIIVDKGHKDIIIELVDDDTYDSYKLLTTHINQDEIFLE